MEARDICGLMNISAAVDYVVNGQGDDLPTFD